MSSFKYKYLESGAPRTLRIGTLPEVVRGDYGMVIWRGWDMAGEYSHAPQFAEYDDDAIECICGEPSCGLHETLPEDDFEKWLNNPTLTDARVCDCGVIDCPKNGRRKNHYCYHAPIWAKWIHTTQEGWLSVEDTGFQPIVKMPDNWKPPQVNYIPKLEGWVYAVALNPDLSLHRLKVGWTNRPIYERMKQYSTGNPNLLLLGLWDTYAHGESVAHDVCDGRIRDTENFDTLDPFETIERIERALIEYNSKRALETNLVTGTLNHEPSLKELLCV